MDGIQLVIYLIIGGYFAFHVFMIFWSWKKSRDGKKYLNELNEETPYLREDEFPDYFECSGLIINNFRPLMDAKVEYVKGEFAVRQSNGKEDFIPLSKIESFTIRPFIHIDKDNMSIMVKIKSKGYGRLQFTIQDLEPWRSILEHAVEQNSTVEK